MKVKPDIVKCYYSIITAAQFSIITSALLLIMKACGCKAVDIQKWRDQVEARQNEEKIEVRND